MMTGHNVRVFCADAVYIEIEQGGLVKELI